MGTKNSPGRYDCYAKAEPDEPMFTLLARDERAPLLVEIWALMSEARGTDPAKVAEARACAQAMREWFAAHTVRTQSQAERERDALAGLLGAISGQFEQFRKDVGEELDEPEDAAVVQMAADAYKAHKAGTLGTLLDKWEREDCETATPPGGGAP